MAAVAQAMAAVTAAEAPPPGVGWRADNAATKLAMVWSPVMNLACSRLFEFGLSFVDDAFDACAQFGQTLFEAFITTINVVDA